MARPTRLIDADAIVYDFGEIDDGLCKRTELYVTDEAIAKQPTIEAEPHWIPCSERLPEDNDYKPFSYYEDGAVLFCTKNGKVGFGWYYESTKEWANEDDCTPGEVIAWMPLPKPYEVYPMPTLQQSIAAWCLLNDLINLGYPHDFQKELPHIRNYMWKVTDLVRDAIHIRDGMK